MAVLMRVERTVFDWECCIVAGDEPDDDLDVEELRILKRGGCSHRDPDSKSAARCGRRVWTLWARGRRSRE